MKTIDSIRAFATALNRKFNVTVRISSGAPCTDGRTIHLPALSEYTDSEYFAVAGSALHETAHMHFGVERLLDRLSLVPYEHKALMHSCLNVVLDINHETRLEPLFDGAPMYFRRKFESMWPKLQKRIAAPDVHAVLVKAIVHYRFRRQADIPGPVTAALDGVGALTDDDALWRAAEALKTALESGDVQNPARQESERKQAQADKLESEVQAHAQAEVDKRAKTPRGRRMVFRRVLRSDDVQAKLGEIDKLRRRVEELEGKQHTALDLDRQELQQLQTDAVQDNRLVETADDAIPHVMPGPQAIPGETFPAHVLRKAAQLRAAMGSIFENQDARVTLSGCSNGRLDTRSLAAARAGGGCFRRDLESLDTSAHIVVILDLSGSMHHAKSQAAIDAAEIIAGALETCSQVDFDIVPYGSRIVDIKPTPGVLEALRGQTYGSTDTAGAIRYALQNIFGRSAKRQKTLFIITDGQPDRPGATQAMLRECRKARISVATIGIQMPEQIGRELFSIAGPYITCQDAEKLNCTLPILAKRAVRTA